MDVKQQLNAWRLKMGASEKLFCYIVTAIGLVAVGLMIAGVI